jgi:dolichol-phosphate mannosyltransferase
MNRLVILIPTYNEAISIVELLDKLSKFRNESTTPFDAVVIDDNSPDGTAAIVDKLSINWVKLLNRSEKGGLGAAYRAGFDQVLKDENYTHVVLSLIHI